MKKCILLICLILVICLFCSCEPLVTTYGEVVHDAVKEHYTSYDILDLIRVEKDGTPTLHNFCLIDDTQGGLDVLLLSSSKSDSDDYITSSTVNADNLELNKVYSENISITGDKFTVQYLVCEKKDIPKSVLQKEEFEFSGKQLYFCIVSITALPAQ